MSKLIIPTLLGLSALILLAACASGPRLKDFKLPDGTPMKAVNNPSAINASYNVLRNFLDGFTISETECGKLAMELHDSAEANGIKAGIVIMKLVEDYHALNVFQTTDQGKIYIDLVYSKECVTMETLKEHHSCMGEIYEFW